jgi:hypothetical protein
MVLTQNQYEDQWNRTEVPDMNPHSYTNLKDPKHSTQKLLYTLNNFSNIAGYKINFKKSVAYLYNNEQIEKEGP